MKTFIGTKINAISAKLFMSPMQLSQLSQLRIYEIFGNDNIPFLTTFIESLLRSLAAQTCYCSISNRPPEGLNPLTLMVCAVSVQRLSNREKKRQNK